MADTITTAERFTIGEWLVEPNANRLIRENEEVRLEPKVMRVLAYLAKHRGEVVSRHDLEAGVWTGVIVTDDAVTNTVIKLRKALGDNARNPKYIETIAKSGYRLIADISANGAVNSKTNNLSGVFGAGVQRHPSLRRHRSKMIAVGAIVLLGILILWLSDIQKDTPSEPVSNAPGSRLVVAVLPFENLSSDPEQDYFSAGITEDLITDLSKISGLKVVARNSVFAYADSTASAQQIGSELRARYLVKGSVRRASESVRINVRLTDTRDGSNRWAERYDRRITDIFRIQDDIAQRVVSALLVELSPGERKRLIRDYATSIEAYDWYLQGLDHFGRRSGADNPLAREYFERAIAIEPSFARAYASLALTYTRSAVNGWGALLDQSLAQAENLALKARSLDEGLPQVYFVLGEVEMYRRNYAAALDQLARAIELKPSYADAYALLGWVLHFAGRPEEGLAAMDQAIELNPRIPGVYQLVQGALHYELEQTEEAIRLLNKAVERNPNYQLANLFLAAAYAADGDLEEANWQITEILLMNPEYTLANVERYLPIRDPIYKERMLQDLRRARLPALNQH